MLFGKNKDKAGQLSLIFDVQSSVVRGALTFLSPGHAPRVVWTQTVDLPYRKGGDSQYLITVALKAIDTIVTGTLHYLGAPHEGIPPQVSSIHYVLSSPWIISQGRTVGMSFPHESRISPEYIQKLLAEERAKLTKGETGDIMVIEEKIFDVRLNGYSVPDWQKRSARAVEVSFATSLAGSRMIGRFKEAVRALKVHNHSVRFHSAPLLQHIAIRTIMPNIGPHAAIHAHGELTDIIIADHSACFFLGSYPTGTTTLIRNIAASLGVSEGEADSFLTAHEAGDLDPKHGDKASGAIIEAVRSWVGQYDSAIATVSLRTLPSHAIISAHSHEVFCAKAFSAAHPEMGVSTLSMDDLRKNVSFDPTAEQMRLVGLYAVAVSML